MSDHEDVAEVDVAAMMDLSNKRKKKKKVKKHNRDQPIPVTILSGFLGSGKTTLMKSILESKEHKMKVAVIVNDMAELNIDASLIQTSVVQTEREVVSLQNGCICCTLRGDLIREIAQIRSSREFDYILIESTGIAEPQAVAQAFVFDPETAELATKPEDMLWIQARLDTCVTVVDAHSFADQISSLSQFGDNYEDGLDKSTPVGRQEGERSIADLLLEQVEFSNVIILNKTDLVSDEEEAETMTILRSLNPTAKIVPTQYSQIELKEILNTGIFDMKKASSSPGWIQTIRSGAEHSEADEYGVTSFVYRARVPFHPDRISGWVDSILHNPNEWKRLTRNQRKAKEDPKHEFMLKHYGQILRAKGFCWLAWHDSFMMGLAQSGRIGTLHAIMPWYAIMTREGWGVPKDSPEYKIIEGKFAKPHGDRRQELVFIGTNLKADIIKQQLDTCLLNQEELKQYKFYSDQRALRK